MTYKKPEQKFISFTNSPEELDEISNNMKAGWSIVSLMRNGNYYVGIMELNSDTERPKDCFFIPARKKIKISR